MIQSRDGHCVAAMDGRYMPKDLIRFDVLVQEALRGVVRKVLTEVARTGLPGDHHFYISFDTTFPGVRVSTRIRQRYPEEMTIVLQHQFWDLTVSDQGFEAGLSFGGIPERLYIPFLAVKGFFDPSVQFGLQFDVAKDAGAEDEEAASDLTEDEVKPAKVPKVAARKKDKDAAPSPVALVPPAEPAEDPAAVPGATVVSLDHFRKKT